ncbi:MAG: polyprenol monophosphomannose synthase [Deltaproteobacteria bacterium]|nr:polyprenol monophosphomannose synthase [Deltaproteobacteria bacterium]
MKFIVIIPTYNEAENIRIIVPRILGLGREFHVLVVDDNSPDGTAKVVKDLMKKDGRVMLMERPGKMGLGSAYIAGFKRALKEGADFVFEMDADHSHDYNDLPRFLKEMDKYDLVIGSRYANGISVVNWPLPRLLLSYFGNVYARLITGLKTFDNTAGFKCFKRKVLESIDLDAIHSNGYAFQIEMNWNAARKGFSIGEIPVIFWGRYSGDSKMSGNIVREAVFIVWRLRLDSISRRLGLKRD